AMPRRASSAVCFGNRRPTAVSPMFFKRLFSTLAAIRRSRTPLVKPGAQFGRRVHEGRDMTLSITKEQIHQLQRRAESAIQRAKSMREEAQHAVETAVQSVEVSASAFAFGLANGRWSGAEVIGLPADLAAGMAMHAFAFMLDGESAEHLHNFGDDALASYAPRIGGGVGKKWRDDAGVLPAVTP